MKRIYFVFLLAFAACKKTDNTPAGASNGGDSYLSCTINGKSYTFQGKPSSLSPTGVSYSYGLYGTPYGGVARALNAIGRDLGGQNAEVVMSILTDTTYRFPIKKRVSFSEVGTLRTYVSLRSSTDFSDKYYYADPATGWINISRADSIGAGTFGFTAYQFDNNGVRIPNVDSVIVTNGKFDIHD